MTRRLEIKHAKLYEDIKPKGKIFMRPQYNATIRALRKLELKIIGMAAACKAIEERSGKDNR